MEHVAIIKKSWKLTDKILAGRKTIESRWYGSKRQPWNCVKKGETVYFKNSGEEVKIEAQVSRVRQFADLTPRRIKEILDKYGKDIGIEKEKISEFFAGVKDKKYCLLIFLKNPVAIKPFAVDKTGFGLLAAWLTVADIAKIKK